MKIRRLSLEQDLSPASLVQELVSRLDDRWDSRQLHVWLHRACETLLPDIHGAATRDGGRRLAQAAATLRVEVSGMDLREAVVSALRDRSRDRLATVAAALMVLDERHHALTELHRAVVELPGPVGPLKTLLLPAAATPFEELLAEKGAELRRPQRYHQERLEDWLGLKLRLVHLDRHPVPPEVKALPNRVSVTLRSRLPDLRVVMASPLADLPLTAKGSPEARRHDQKVSFRLVSLTHESDAARARDELDALVARCRDERIDLLILPELCLPPAQLAHLRARLSEGSRQHPALVVAGSWHVERGEGRWVNRCEVLDGAGRTLWTHDKRSVYDIPPEAAARMPDAQLQMLGIDEHGGVEEIELGRTLSLLDGPWGRMAALICKDFISDDLRGQLRDTGANLLLVPAMSERTEPFEERAREWGSLNRAVSLVANSGWLLAHEPPGSAGNTAIALAYLPGRGTLRRWTDGERWVMFTICQLCDAREHASSDRVVDIRSR